MLLSALWIQGEQVSVPAFKEITPYLGRDKYTGHFKEVRQILRSPGMSCLLNGCSFFFFFNIVWVKTKVIFTYVQTYSGHCVHVIKDNLGVVGSFLSFWAHLKCPLLWEAFPNCLIWSGPVTLPPTILFYCHYGIYLCLASPYLLIYPLPRADSCLSGAMLHPQHPAQWPLHRCLLHKWMNRWTGGKKDPLVPNLQRPLNVIIRHCEPFWYMPKPNRLHLFAYPW